MPRHKLQPTLEPEQHEDLRLQLLVRGEVADILRRISDHTGQSTAEVAKRLIGIAARQDWDSLKPRRA